MRSIVLRRLALALSLALPLLAVAAAAAAQTDTATLGAQNLRPYWHVFTAYALAWVLVLGWLVSVARRLTRLERSLGN